MNKKWVLSIICAGIFLPTTGLADITIKNESDKEAKCVLSTAYNKYGKADAQTDEVVISPGSQASIPTSYTRGTQTWYVHLLTCRKNNGPSTRIDIEKVVPSTTRAISIVPASEKDVWIIK